MLPTEDISVGTAAVIACQSLGGAVFVPVGSTILQNKLLAGNVPSVYLHTVLHDGASTFRNNASATALPAILKLYNSALRDFFHAATVACGLALLSILGLEWHRNLLRNERGRQR